MAEFTAPTQALEMSPALLPNIHDSDTLKEPNGLKEIFDRCYDRGSVHSEIWSTSFISSSATARILLEWRDFIRVFDLDRAMPFDPKSLLEEIRSEGMEKKLRAACRKLQGSIDNHGDGPVTLVMLPTDCDISQAAQIVAALHRGDGLLVHLDSNIMIESDEKKKAFIHQVTTVFDRIPLPLHHLTTAQVHRMVEYIAGSTLPGCRLIPSAPRAAEISVSGEGQDWSFVLRFTIDNDVENPFEVELLVSPSDVDPDADIPNPDPSVVFRPGFGKAPKIAYILLNCTRQQYQGFRLARYIISELTKVQGSEDQILYAAYNIKRRFALPSALAKLQHPQASTNPLESYYGDADMFQSGADDQEIRAGPFIEADLPGIPRLEVKEVFHYTKEKIQARIVDEWYGLASIEDAWLEGCRMNDIHSRTEVPITVPIRNCYHLPAHDHPCHRCFRMTPCSELSGHEDEDGREICSACWPVRLDFEDDGYNEDEELQRLLHPETEL